ncbi:MAG TPA: butyrate kinase [Candidatus Coatesbacteria bacterium]|nr:butyrate kinase [Candidatus Coatesbacteria bacterium]
MARHHILVINPGSTSTKVAVYADEEPIHERNLQHVKLDLEGFAKIWDQYAFRKRIILEFLEEVGFDLSKLSAVVGRGGLFQPVVSGTYAINQQMISDGREGYSGEHASNLGCALAYGVAWDLKIPSYIVDPPSVDEFPPVAKLSGLPELPRRSLFHALNVKATARRAAKEMGKTLAETNIIVAHLGGGISIVALEKGRAIEAHNGLYEGPYTPERAGTLPTFPLMEWVFEETQKDTPLEALKRRCVGGGGLVAYLGTNSAYEVEQRAAGGDRQAEHFLVGMLYQISYYIGAVAVALKGKVDCIALTGGMAHGKMIVERITDWAGWIAPVKVYPGQDEMGALALGALRVLRGEDEALEYPTYVGDGG